MVPTIYVIFAVLAAVICVIGASLNSLVCLVFYRTKKFLNAPNIFIASVALSDLLYCVTSLPLLVVTNIHGRWIYGDYGCKATAFIATWSGLTSIMNLSLAGYERYIALVFLYKSQQTFTRRRAIRATVAMWLYALFWAIMPLCGWSGFEQEGIGTSCSLRWKSRDKLDLSYHTCLIFACYVLPVSIMITSYHKSCRELNKGAKRAKKTWGKTSPFTKKALEMERKMVILFGAMTIAFLVAWTPYAVVSLVAMIAGPDVISDVTASIPAYVAKSSFAKYSESCTAKISSLQEMENITSPPPKVPKDSESSHVGLQIAFCLIATTSFAFNLLFCVMLLRNPTMLKKAHNILLFSLAVVDVLTGVFIVATPGYVILKSSYPVPHGAGGEVFCRLLSNRYLLFAMGKVSILLVACLAIERWFCVFRPMKYEKHFSRKRVLIYVGVMFIVTCILSMNKFFEISVSGEKCITKKAPYGKEGTRAFIVTYSVITFYMPCLSTWFTFADIAINLPSSPSGSANVETERKLQKVLLRMCALAAVALTVCGFPAQTIYTLSPFGITKIGSSVHKTFNVLVLFNSCMNPFIYYFSNKEYRKAFKDLLRCKGKQSGRDMELETQVTG
ncbi:Rhodopsin, G0-coupled [Stylophora pistillata]|uniref:Rhodopsin, G0-coupled n=2 Tax=Stylophora pistillata TaxID=50429 RepID=A0A2B4S7R9_STYPI|nr:Rhodopsin, G0-coupled [Stylophora pistillata]